MTFKVSAAPNIITTEDKSSHLILKMPAEPVKFPLSQADKKIISVMEGKLSQIGGVGLAAPQINEKKKIIAIYISEIAAAIRDNAAVYPMHILINPMYEGIERDGFVHDFEACYSISNKAGKVPRYKKIIFSYQDESGEKYIKTATGFYARVLQHEIDHINGILIIDRLTPGCVQGNLKDMMALRRSELTDEQKIQFDKLIQE